MRVSHKNDPNVSQRKSSKKVSASNRSSKSSQINQSTDGLVDSNAVQLSINHSQINQLNSVDYPYCCIHQRSQHVPNYPMHHAPHAHYHSNHHVQPYAYQHAMNHAYQSINQSYHPPPPVMCHCCQHAQPVYPTYPIMNRSNQHADAPSQPIAQPKPMIAWSQTDNTQHTSANQNQHQYQHQTDHVNQSQKDKAQTSSNPHQHSVQINQSQPIPESQPTQPTSMIYPSWWPTDSNELTSEELRAQRLSQQRQRRMSQHQHDMRKATQVASHFCPPASVQRSHVSRNKASSENKQHNKQPNAPDTSFNVLSTFSRSSKPITNHVITSRPTSHNTSPRSSSRPNTASYDRKPMKQVESRISSLIERDRRDYYDRNALQSANNLASSSRSTNVDNHSNETLASLVQRLSQDAIVNSFM